MASAWFEKTPLVTFHDPLAASGIFELSLCVYKWGAVNIELENSMLLGKTHWTPEGYDPQEIAVSEDAPRFFEHCFGVLEMHNR